LFEGICFTGEMTLRGVILPVGGVKEKAIAAKRAGKLHSRPVQLLFLPSLQLLGFKKVVLPKNNKKNLADVSKNIKVNVSSMT